MNYVRQEMNMFLDDPVRAASGLYFTEQEVCILLTLSVHQIAFAYIIFHYLINKEKR